jgi:hypothetical protein
LYGAGPKLTTRLQTIGSRTPPPVCRVGAGEERPEGGLLRGICRNKQAREKALEGPTHLLWQKWDMRVSVRP